MATTDDNQRRDRAAAIRIGDAERQRMTELLQRHVAAGRLDMPEFERRVDHATSAVYEQDLEGLLDDLPAIDEDGDPVGPRGHVGGGRSDDGRAWEAASWWPRPGLGRDGPGWGPRMAPFPLLALAAVALVVATHGWILFPLLFLFFFARGGGCGPRRYRDHGARHGRDVRHTDRSWDGDQQDRPAWPGRFEPSGDDRRL